jgi:hypothetical protein
MKILTFDIEEWLPAGADLQSAPHKPWIYNPLKPAVKIHTPACMLACLCRLKKIWL